MAGWDTFNQTNVELKPFCQSQELSGFCSFNQTNVELKLETIMSAI